MAGFWSPDFGELSCGKIFVVSRGNCRGMMASQAVISLGYRQMVFEVQWILFSRFPQDRDCACWKLCLNIRGKGYPVLSFVAFRIACPLSILRHPTNGEFIMKRNPIIHLWPPSSPQYWVAMKVILHNLGTPHFLGFLTNQRPWWAAEIVHGKDCIPSYWQIPIPYSSHT